jgi:hypothetical protein
MPQPNPANTFQLIVRCYPAAFLQTGILLQPGGNMFEFAAMVN